MWFRHRAWIPIAWVLSLINFGGVWFAARDGQAWHGTIHASLALLFAVGAQRLQARQRPALKSPAEDPTAQGRTLEDVEACFGELDQLKRRVGGLGEGGGLVGRPLPQQAGGAGVGARPGLGGSASAPRRPGARA